MGYLRAIAASAAEAAVALDTSRKTFSSKRQILDELIPTPVVGTMGDTTTGSCPHRNYNIVWSRSKAGRTIVMRSGSTQDLAGGGAAASRSGGPAK